MLARLRSESCIGVGGRRCDLLGDHIVLQQQGPQRLEDVVPLIKHRDKEVCRSDGGIGEKSLCQVPISANQKGHKGFADPRAASDLPSNPFAVWLWQLGELVLNAAG